MKKSLLLLITLIIQVLALPLGSVAFAQGGIQFSPPPTPEDSRYIPRNKGVVGGYMDFLAYPVVIAPGGIDEGLAGKSILHDATFYWNQAAIVASYKPALTPLTDQQLCRFSNEGTIPMFYVGNVADMQSYQVSKRNAANMGIAPGLKNRNSYWIFYSQGSSIHVAGYNVYGIQRGPEHPSYESMFYQINKFNMHFPGAHPRSKGAVAYMEEKPYSAMVVYGEFIKLFLYMEDEDKWQEIPVNIQSSGVLWVDFVSTKEVNYLAYQHNSGGYSTISVYSSTDLHTWRHNGSVIADPTNACDKSPRWGMAVDKAGVLGLSWSLDQKLLYTEFADPSIDLPSGRSEVYVLQDISGKEPETEDGKSISIPQSSPVFASSTDYVIVFWIMTRRFHLPDSTPDYRDINYITMSVFNRKTKQVSPQVGADRINSIFISSDLKPAYRLMVRSNFFNTKSLLFADMRPYLSDMSINTYATFINPQKIIASRSMADPENVDPTITTGPATRISGIRR